MKKIFVIILTLLMAVSCSSTSVTGPAVLIGDIHGNVGQINVYSSPLDSFLEDAPVNLRDGHFEVTFDDVEDFIDLVTVLDDDVFGARINALDTVRMVFTVKSDGHFDVEYDGANEEEGAIWADWYRTYGDIVQYNLRPDRDPGIPVEESLRLLHVNDSLFRAVHSGTLSHYHLHRANLGRDFLTAVLMEFKAYDEGSDIWENPDYSALIKKLDPNDPFLPGSGLMARWANYVMKDLGEDDITREIRFFKEYKGKIKNVEARKFLAKNLSFTLRMEPGRFNDSTCTEYIEAIRGFCPECQELIDDCSAAWTAYGNTRPGADMPDMEMFSPDGTEVLLSSLFGKVLYIDMWATWCGPCVRETPYMAALAERMKDRDDILCISVSTDNTDEPWQESLSNAHPDWPQYRIKPKSMDEFGKKMNISFIPRFIIVDKDGKIFDADAIRPSDSDIDRVLSEAAGK